MAAGDYGALRIFVTADTRALGQQIAQAATDAGTEAGQRIGTAIGAGLGRVASGFGAALSSAFDIVSNITAVGVTAAAGVGAAAIRAGIDYNSLSQRAQAAFTTILGSGAAATAMMDDLSRFASTSPFPRQAFIDAAQSMLAFGIESRDVVPYLGAVQDAIAASGGSAQDIAELTDIFGKISAAGRITGTDLMQFARRGINAADLIGSHMGMTGEEIREEIRGGAIDAQTALDALAAAMTARFGGAAQNVKQTWVGATDSVRASMRDLGSALVEPFISKQGGGLAIQWAGQLAGTLRELIPAAGEIAAQIGAKLSGIVDKVGPVFASLRETFSGLGGLAAPLLALFGAKGLGNITGMLGPLGKLVPTLNPIVAAIAALVISSPELREALMGVLDTLRPLLPIVGDVAAALGGELSRILAAIIPVVAEVAQILAAGLAQALGALLPALIPLAGALGDVLIAVLPLLVPLAELVALIIGSALGPLLVLVARGLTLVAQAVTFVVRPLVSLVAGILRFVTSLSGVGSVVSSVLGWFRQIPAVIGAAVSWFLDLGGAVGRGLGGMVSTVASVVSSVIGWFRSLVSGISSALAPVVNIVSAVFGRARAIFEYLIGGFVDIAKGIVNLIVGIFTFDLGKIGAAVRQIFGGLLRQFVALPVLLFTAIAHFGPKLLSWIGGVFASFGSLIANGITAAVRWFAQLPGRAISALASLGGRLLSLGTSALAALGRAVLAGIVNAAKFIATLPARAVSALASLAGRLVSTGTAALSSMGRGILAGIVAAARFIGELPGRAVSALGSLGSRLVSTATSSLSSMGRAIVSGIGNAVSFFREFPGRALSAIASLASGLAGKAREALSSMVSALGGAVGSLLGWFRSLPGKIVSAVGSIGSQMAQIGRSIVSGIISGIGDIGSMIWNKIKGGLTGLVGKAKGALGIGSPSRVFADEVGAPITQGIIAGLQSQIPALNRAVAGLVDVPDVTVPGPHLGAHRPLDDRTLAAGVAATSHDPETRALLRTMARYLQSGTAVIIDREPVATAVSAASLYGVMA